jgi:hypothetical protein
MEKNNVNLPSTDLTSISDKDSYVSIVEIACRDSITFDKFRSCKEYKEILEHVSPWQGRQYIEWVFDQGYSRTWIRNVKTELQQFSEIGGPQKYYFFGIGNVSPTFFRYLKVHCELTNLFGNLDQKSICEIGGGFGGQAVLTSKLSQLSGYCIYDLPSVTQLQRKFVGFFCNSDSLVEWRDGKEPTPSKGDLIISNYAFSELTRPMQEIYIERVIANYPMGYITWNDLSERTLGGLSIMEFCKIIPNVTVIDENPSTSRNNKILFWNN